LAQAAPWRLPVSFTPDRAPALPGLCYTADMAPYRHRVLSGDTDQMGVVYYATCPFATAACRTTITNPSLRATN